MQPLLPKSRPVLTLAKALPPPAKKGPHVRPKLGNNLFQNLHQEEKNYPLDHYAYDMTKQAMTAVGLLSELKGLPQALTKTWQWIMYLGLPFSLGAAKGFSLVYGPLMGLLGQTGAQLTEFQAAKAQALTCEPFIKSWQATPPKSQRLVRNLFKRSLHPTLATMKGPREFVIERGEFRGEEFYFIAPKRVLPKLSAEFYPIDRFTQTFGQKAYEPLT